MVPLIAFICVLEPVRQRKKFSIEKNKIFLFQVFDFWFFKKIFILQQCRNPNPYPNNNFFRIRIQPKHSDYFGFGSTTLLDVHQAHTGFFAAKFWCCYPNNQKLRNAVIYRYFCPTQWSTIDSYFKESPNEICNIFNISVSFRLEESLFQAVLEQLREGIIYCG
jgi:hypothetical protein